MGRLASSLTRFTAVGYAGRMSDSLTPADLRVWAVTGSLGPKQALQSVLDRLGFVQADPIRAPARAQDLILMQRVTDYRAGDLERLYPELDVEEDYFPNYGFVSRPVWSLLHPRAARPWRIEQQAPGLMEQVLAHVRERGELHPREAGEVFGRTRVGNAWGGGSNAATRALEALHRSGHLRIVRRESGIKVYAPARPHPGPQDSAGRLRALVMVLARLYAPASESGLRLLVGLSQSDMPGALAEARAALKLAVQEGALTRAVVDGAAYLYPTGEAPSGEVRPELRLVAPFDPLTWDRRRFELLHGWTYRFEAYTPAPKRQLGYYALPLFWNERALGWANLKVTGGVLTAEVSTLPGLRRTAAFTRALNAELERHRAFLGAAEVGLTLG